MICCVAAALFIAEIAIHWRQIMLFFGLKREKIDEEFRY
jgi:hypothetical protein